MNTVIVPVDFSETSLNSARYAAKMLESHEGVEMILYHAYEKDSDEYGSIGDLERLQTELSANTSLNITILAEKGDDFIEELERLSRHRQADLVIMGITGRSPLAQRFMGSNTLKAAAHKFVPVLIIPPDCSFKEVKNVLLATDLKDVVQTIPSAPIKKVLKTFHPNLHVVNVNESHYIALTEEHEAEKRKLADMFDGFNPEFYFLRLFDIDAAINQFAEDKDIDLIINVHKEHSVLHKLFINSHTKNLAYQSRVPVLVVHE
jgi:nucleotide-binding universal stress UspA family protein